MKTQQDFEATAVQRWIAGGERDENRLTDELFFARHPERQRRKIERRERWLAKEWLWLRDELVRPALARAATADVDDVTGAVVDSSVDPRTHELTRMWERLMVLRDKRNGAWESLQENPLYLEAQLLRALFDLGQIATTVPPEIWSDLRAFASCDVDPMLARIEQNEDYANAVLGTINGISSILQGYLGDQLDEAAKESIERARGWDRVAIQVFVKVLKRQIPVVQKEIDTGNLRAIGSAFEQLKTQVADEGLSVQVVWANAVDLAEELLREAIENAVQDGAEAALRFAAKRILGSAARASVLLFLAEDFMWFVHAATSSLAHTAYDREFNALLIKFLALLGEDFVIGPGRHPFTVYWKIPCERLECRFVMRSFQPDRGAATGDGKGKWLELPLSGGLRENGSVVGAMQPKVDIPVPAGAADGTQALAFDLPDRKKWPTVVGSYAVAELAMFGDGDKELATAVSLVAPCA